MSDVPVLRTERLVLREHRPDDLDAYMALWADEDVVRFISGKPLDRQDCWGRIMRFRGMWTLLGFGFWIIEDRVSGLLIGEAGLMDAKRTIEPPLDDTIETGWALLPSMQGRGLAREAMQAALEWADRNQPGIPQSCIISDENTPSILLARRLGFRESARSDFHGSKVIQFRRERT